MNEGNFDDNYYCVYCHRNLANGKVYIGITNDTHNRWRSDGSGYANQPASASRLTGDSQPAIWDCCNNRRGKTNAGKYSWRYATDEEVGNNLRGVSGNV